MRALKQLPDEVLIEEAKRRDRERLAEDKKPREKMRKCLGCKKKFNARDMRTHPCKVGWTKRQPYKLVKRGEGYAYVLDND